MTFVVAGGVFVWGIGRPAPWIDEAATWQAVHRGWWRLLAMLGGSDAPLVPYYLVAKLWTAVGGQQVASLRVLSAMLAAAAVSCLALLLARWSGWGTGLTAAGLLIGLAGFDRFAQEARPYALLAFLVCASWLTWDYWRCSRSRRAGALFGLLTAALGVTHLFGLLMLPAQVLADRTDPDRIDPDRTDSPGLQPSPAASCPRRSVLCWLDRWWPGWRAARGTAAWGIAGVLVADVQVGVAMVNGSGPTANVPVTPANLWQTEVISLSASRAAPAAVAWIVALAALGAVLVAHRRWRRTVTPLLWWALLPLALASAMTMAQPNLLRARYWTGTLPAVAGLAAVGVMVVARAAARLVRRTLRVGPRAGRIVAAGVALALIAVHVAVEASSQLAIRTGAGHGEDGVEALRIAAAAADRDGNPIVISPTTGALVMSVVENPPSLVRPLYLNDPGRREIWPVERPPSAVAADLAGVRTLHWLYRKPGGTLLAGPVTRMPPMEYVRGDVPAVLAGRHFRVVEAAQVSPGWILATLTRDYGPRTDCGPGAGTPADQRCP